MSATPAISDERISLFLNQRPAAEVLGLLARHLDFEWRVAGSGYELVRSEAAQRRAEALEEQETRPQLAAIRERMELLARMWAMPRPELEARQERVAALLERTNLDARKRAALEDEQQALQDVLCPGADMALKLYRLLDAEQLRQLFAGHIFRYSTLDRSLPSALAQQIHADIAAERPKLAAALDPRTKQADAVLRVRDDPPFASSPETACQRSIFLQISELSGDDRQSCTYPWVPHLPRVPPTPPVQTQTIEPELKRRVVLASQPFVLPNPGTGAWAPSLTLGEIIAAVHRQTELEFVADGYVRARLEPRTLAAPRSVVGVLDEIASTLHYDWRKEGNLVLLRSQLYYRDRRGEVPERLLRSWKKQVAADGGQTLDNLAALAAALTDEQAWSLYTAGGWYLADAPPAIVNSAAGFFPSRHALRLWAALTTSQKQAAVVRPGLPVSQMSPHQREVFRTALISDSAADPHTVPGPMRANHAPAPEALESGSLFVEQNEYQEGSYTYGGDTAVVILKIPKGGVLPRRVDGAEPHPVGAPTDMLGSTFAFYLGRHSGPVRKDHLALPRPGQTQPLGSPFKR